jgi:serine/threonine-protein kinase
MNVENPNELPALPARAAIPLADDVSVSAVRRYALHAEIASGSLSTVHLGRLVGPERFERTVAVKRLRPPYAKDPECVSSLLEGARVAANVRHPNVVPALDVVTGDDVLVVTEYVRGESLAALLRTERGRGAQTPLAVVSGVVAGVLRGLDAVQVARAARPPSGDHARPRRGFIAAQDVVVGIDGVARLIDVVGRSDAGSVHPVAEAGDEPSAWYGVSVVLWEALAGRALLPRTPEGFEAPSRYRKGLDPAVDAVVTKGLASEPASGFRTAGEMAQALEAVLPPAMPSQIGGWVESLAREALDERARWLAEIEDPVRPEPPQDAAVPPAAAIDAKTQITRRLRSTPPPAPAAPPGEAPRDVARADRGRAEVTARVWRGATLRRKRVATMAAGIVVPALLVFVCARYARNAQPAARTGVPAATSTPATPARDEVALPTAPLAPRAEATTPRHEEPPPPSAPRPPRLRPAAADPVAAPRPSPSRPAAPDPTGTAKLQPAPRLMRDDVL